MNVEPRTRFTEEELVAFICGTGSAATNASIERALEAEEELYAQVAFLRALMPNARRNPQSEKLTPAKLEGSLDTVPAANVEETVAQSGARDSNAGKAEEALSEDLRVIADLDRQGLNAKQIGERIGVTQTLVELKLRRIRKLRSEDRG